MIEALITSKTRIKLLVKFFLNSQSKSYLRKLVREINEAPNTIRVELMRLENAGLLSSEHVKNRKYFFANTQHPFYIDIHSLVSKNLGINQLTDQLSKHITGLEAVYITGEIALGHDSKIIDIVMVGQKLNNASISKMLLKTEKYITRKIRHIELTSEQMEDYFHDKPAMLIWEENTKDNEVVDYKAH